MTILEVLSDEHREVSQLLKTISRSRSAKSREKHFVEMKQMLEMHAFLEQLVFYSALLDSTSHKVLIEHAQEEHQRITDALAELDSIPKHDKEWMPKFHVLKEMIQDHVKEEEGEIFDQARKSFNQERLQRLGAEMVTRKAEQLAVQ